MKITPEDMGAVRAAINLRTPSYDTDFEARDIALGLILVRIYDRGFDRGYEEAMRDYEEVNRGEL